MNVKCLSMEVFHKHEGIGRDKDVFAVGRRNEDPDVALRDDINIHKCHTFLDKALFQDM